MKMEPGVTYAYCACGRRFRADECVDGKVPEHLPEPSPFDAVGYRSKRCVDSGKVPVHVGAIA